jgi:ribonucleoside-diphosphate reductase alpha chain
MLRNFNSTARYVDQCFVPGTLIYTKNGAKPIEDVSVSDSVLTSDGTYHSVVLPVRHEYKGAVLDIQIKNSVSSVKVTPEHQVMALSGQALGLNFDVIKNRLDKRLVEVKFHDAKDLVPGDFLVFPIPTYVKDIANLSEEDCRMYGILLGDGSISEAVSGVTIGSKKKAVGDFVTEYLTSRGVNVNTYVEDDTTRLRWSSANPGFKFVKSQLYDGSMKKMDTPFLHLPLNKMKQVVRGLLETDGCIGSKEITVEMTSPSVIEGLRYMLLRLGALSSGYDRDRVGNISDYKNITTRLTTKVLRVPRVSEILELFPEAPESRSFSFALI